jgi:hypothetical protein
MTEPELLAHREWLGYLQPVGVVVSPPALLNAQAYVNRNVAPLQQLLLDVVGETPWGAALTDVPKFLTHVLRWDDTDLVDAPSELECVLPEYGEVLQATYAVRDPEPAGPESTWMMLIQVLPDGTDLDAPSPAEHRGWQASPEAKFERLLREARVPIGLLVNGTSIRLVYAPRGETSGHLSFAVTAMAEVPGRPILAALDMLLGAERLFTLPQDQRLPAVLVDSRRYQNEVSTRLAGQVLAGLYELLRGFQAADDQAQGELLHGVLSEEPDLVYEGLLTVLLRLVFLLYAEDRDLMPVDDVYSLHYSVGALFERLRGDAGRYPDTMDLRYGSWAQLLSVFRTVYDGASFGKLHLPARQGHLFDPDRFPFLEGRPYGLLRVIGHRIDPPLVPDGIVWRVLQNLVVLDGERLSYRSLDVEQIGSVYETMMGFRLEIAGGHSLALKPAKPQGAPITVNIDELVATAPSKRAQWVREQGEQKLTPKEAAALGSAVTIAEVEAVMERKIDRRATPAIVPAGAMILQPNEERRRSGSFYTPRSLTEPIVQTTLRPLFERLGDNPTPEAILDLKICDPAMGSGAFLVEACRQLADKLVDSWHAHNCIPRIPADSDELLHARRLVAHRCLYGVDRNPIAVDLGKLSLWLATLARDHAFTFVDHALRCGDSLVGLTRDQIVAFHWLPGREQDFITRSLLQSRLDSCERLRVEIREASDDADILILRHLLRAADDALDDLRLAGDLVILAFLSGNSQRQRQEQRDRLAQQVWVWQQGGDSLPLRGLVYEMHTERHVVPFHWEIEFPEVFDREHPGFDAIVGNPPFLGAKEFGEVTPPAQLAFIKETFGQIAGKTDLIAYFFRRSWSLIRDRGAQGLIATNTLAQGDTHASGLLIIHRGGGVIYSATKRLRWPGPAAVIVSVVHIVKGDYLGQRTLNGKTAQRISTYLFERGPDEPPSALFSNVGYAGKGVIPSGDGFVFGDDGEDRRWPLSLAHELRLDPTYAGVIKPFWGSREINASSNFVPLRYVIDLGDMTETELQARLPRIYSMLLERVKPEREKLTTQSGAQQARKYWWQFTYRADALLEQIKQKPTMLGVGRHTHWLSVCRLPSDAVPSEALIAIAFDSYAAFNVLQSRVHETWARFFGSSLKDDLRYTPSDCFDTFPFPNGWVSNSSFEEIGREYYQFRGRVMVRNSEGLTKTYNRFHDPNERDPEILRLRDLHGAVDRTVLDAYHWSDIATDCEFLLDYDSDDDDGSGKKPWRYRWPDDVLEQVLARLLDLNAERTESERLILGDRAARIKARRPTGPARPLPFGKA